MDFGLLPGPSLAERARTALVRAAAATVSEMTSAGGWAVVGTVPVRSGRDGSLLLLPAAGSLLERRLDGCCPGAVTVSVPAWSPFSALRLSGPARPAVRDSAARVTLRTVEVRSIELAGAAVVRIPLAEYRAAAPDPLWRKAPGILAHLEHGHMADLVGCVRAHGLAAADWVIPRALDRYGLEFLVLTADGVAAVRLSFPDGPVTSIQDVPASIRTTLTCRCQSPDRHHDGRSASP